MDDIDVEFNSVGFENAIKALAASGAIVGSDPVRTAIRSEVGSILKTCAGRTKVSTEPVVTSRERVRTLWSLELTSTQNSPVSITAGAKVDSSYGRVWRRLGSHSSGRADKSFDTDRHSSGADGWKQLQQTHAAGFAPLWLHFKDGDWIDIQEAIAAFKSDSQRRVPRALKSIGIARQSWVQIADSLGIDLESVPGGGASPAAIAKARAAIGPKGQTYQNGMSSEVGAAQSYLVTLINGFPKIQQHGLDSILVGAINGRVKFYEKNVSLGVFDSIEKILNAYPGILNVSYN
ncbi:MAG: hypothetical protein WC378_00935 [Opitutaceae bacterium]|jgi:hypothetical protein